MGILDYFLHAGIVVKLVMFLLLAASITSWTFIFQRAWFFKEKKAHLDDFSSQFQDSEDLGVLYTTLQKNEDVPEGLAAIFTSGFKEYLRAQKQGVITLESIQRVMQITHVREALNMEKHLPFLATVGSVTPLVGLFGTVWGIMTAMQSLGQAQQATIGMVAPGISEALVATALGLFTAIPAAIAYNRFSARANGILEEYDLFQEEFVALIEQQAAPAE